MVKVTSTVAIGALSLPLLASALPCPLVQKDARGLTIEVRDMEEFDDLDARGFVESVENGARKVGHELKKVATSPVGQIATTVAIGALLARNPNYFEELEGRGVLQNVTQKVEDFLNSNIVAGTIPALIGHGLQTHDKTLLAPPTKVNEEPPAKVKVERRDFDDFNEVYSRGAWQTVKDDVKKGVHKVEDFFDTPIGAAVKKIGVNQGMNQIKKYRATKSVKSQPVAIKSPTTSVEEPASKPISKPVSKAIVEERDLWELDEIEARGVLQKLENGAKNVGQKVADFANSPFGQAVTQAGLTFAADAAKVLRELELDEFDARDFDLDEREDIDARGLLQNLKTDVTKVTQQIEDSIYYIPKPLILTPPRKVARELEFDEFDARDFDLDERYFDDELDEIYGREYEIDELD